MPGIPGPGWTLYIWPPLGHTGGKLTRRLDALRVPRAQGADGRAVVVGMDDLLRAGGLEALAADLSAEEQQDSSVLGVRGTDAPGFADYPRVTSLFRLMRLEQSETLAQTLTAGRIGASFTPITAADDASEVVAYRANLHFPDLEIASGDVFTLATDGGLLFQLDRVCRVACIREAANQGLDRPVFVQFHPSSIYDPVYCLRTTVSEVERTGLAAEDVVFTLSRAGSHRDIGHLQTILGYYKDRGFQVALGELGAERGALELLQHLRPEYVWLSHDVTAGVSQDPFRAVIARKLLEMAHRLRIETVAIGSLGDTDREWLYEHGVSALAMPERATQPGIPEGLALTASEDVPG
ncbi:EAL domain-containing protein [Limimonas halophila]|uniref:EAL domain-containing protein n=1 Tax=Limimonas halophila TaxID=1082479 RepID=UPI0015A1C707|nr:EAL domain-containing protein [Limimonas halophila]